MSNEDKKGTTETTTPSTETVTQSSSLHAPVAATTSPATLMEAMEEDDEFEEFEHENWSKNETTTTEIQQQQWMDNWDDDMDDDFTKNLRAALIKN
jgi:DSS1/SEM1 family